MKPLLANCCDGATCSQSDAGTIPTAAEDAHRGDAATIQDVFFHKYRFN